MVILSDWTLEGRQPVESVVVHYPITPPSLAGPSRNFSKTRYADAMVVPDQRGIGRFYYALYCIHGTEFVDVF